MAKTTPNAEVQLARVRRICAGFPGTVEKLSHGEPTFFTPKRVFAMFANHHHNDDHLAVWLPAAPGTQEAVIAESPEIFFRPPYVGSSGWIGVELEEVTDEQLESLIREAFQLSSRKRPSRADSDSAALPRPARAPVKVDPRKVLEFKDAQSFYKWLGEHHDQQNELWIKIHKLGSGLKSITPKEAIDVALCWGWIDAIRKGFDEQSYLQRYTPRGSKSIWSQINVDNVARLIEEGRMTEHGLKHVEAAKSDGRWLRAYKSGRDMKIPDDLQAAIDAEPRAKSMLQRLSAQNRFALAFRIHNLKTEAARKKRITAFVQMLKRGETIHPQRVPSGL